MKKLTDKQLTELGFVLFSESRREYRNTHAPGLFVIPKGCTAPELMKILVDTGEARGIAKGREYARVDLREFLGIYIDDDGDVKGTYNPQAI